MVENLSMFLFHSYWNAVFKPGSSLDFFSITHIFWVKWNLLLRRFLFASEMMGFFFYPNQKRFWFLAAENLKFKYWVFSLSKGGGTWNFSFVSFLRFFRFFLLKIGERFFFLIFFKVSPTSSDCLFKLNSKWAQFLAPLSLPCSRPLLTSRREDIRRKKG